MRLGDSTFMGRSNNVNETTSRSTVVRKLSGDKSTDVTIMQRVDTDPKHV